MKKSISFWQFIGFVAVSVAGSLLHFLYEWSGNNVLIASFAAVNESTWEHMKLLYFPLFVFALIERRFFKEYENFWCVKLAGFAVGLGLIPVLFYTYNGMFGKSPDWFNIAIFFVAAAVTFLLETRLFKNESLTCRSPMTALTIIVLMCLVFVLFTFATPHLPLFEDPITGTYGLSS